MKKWRRWLWAIHRDLGYFFFATTIIYALSGIAINHIGDWNPNFVVNTTSFNFKLPAESDLISKKYVINELKRNKIDAYYKKHYFPNEQFLKVFVKNGTISVSLTDGDALYESIHRRPIFHAVNYLHYNPIKYWTWFSDAYAVALIILAVSGLFLLKGKKGITGRGAWLTGIGILIPLIFLFLYY